jgi:hypothetical protein
VSEPASPVDLDGGGRTVPALVGGGLVALVLGWILHSRLLRVLGVVTAAVGAGLFAKAKLAERGEKIDAAQSRIRSELDELDPIARAQVLESLVRPEES